MEIYGISTRPAKIRLHCRLNKDVKDLNDLKHFLWLSAGSATKERFSFRHISVEIDLNVT